MSRLEEIKHKLTQLADADPNLKAFGSQKHKYTLNPCLNESQVQAIEQQYNFKLPDIYRRFITEVGNGGAGPYYGLKPLEDSFPKRLMERDPDMVSKPFTLTEPIFALQSCVGSPDLDDYFKRIETDEDYYDRIMECVRQYSKPEYSQGAILLSDYGDGVLFIMAVNGPESGNVWIDEMVNLAGFFPMAPEDKPAIRTNFLDWYENWLDLSLLRARGEAEEDGIYFEFANQVAII